jgi:hypothetical protein
LIVLHPHGNAGSGSTGDLSICSSKREKVRCAGAGLSGFERRLLKGGTAQKANLP